MDQPTNSATSEGSPRPALLPYAGPADAALEAELLKLMAEHASLEKEFNAKSAQVEQLTASAVRSQSEAEVGEEKITNRLLKRLDGARRNKEAIKERLRRETDEKAAVTGQIAEVQASLVELENQIETEQNRILHKLQRDLIEVSATKANVQRELHAERGAYLSFLRSALDSFQQQQQQAEAAAGECSGFFPAVADPSTSAAPAAAGEGGEASASPPFSPVAPNPQHGTAGATSLPPSAASVAVLQEELNALIADHCAAEQALAEDGMVCDMLGQMLSRVHNEVAMERDRLAMMEADLQRAQADMAIASAANSANAGIGMANGGNGGNSGVGTATIGGIGRTSSYGFSSAVTAARGSSVPRAGGAVHHRHADAFALLGGSPRVGGGGGGTLSDDGELSTCSSYASAFQQPPLMGGAVVNSVGAGVGPTSTMATSASGTDLSPAPSSARKDAMAIGTPLPPTQQPRGADANAAHVAVSGDRGPLVFSASSAAGHLLHLRSGSSMARSPSASSIASVGSSVAALRNHTHHVLSSALGGGRGTPL